MAHGIYQYLDCSIGHITKETSEFLERVYGTNDICQTVASYEYGYFVSVPPEAEYDESVPTDLREILDFARSKGCLILRLDTDGDTHPELKFFDW